MDGGGGPAGNAVAIKKSKRAAILLVGLSLALAFAPVAVLKAPAELPVVVLRIDDIQDYAFKSGQLFLLDEGMTNDIPMSLAVIPGFFGEDREIVDKVKLAVKRGSEITAHGWVHEDLGALSRQEQAVLLGRARARLKEVLACEPETLVPPIFSFNEDTITAMRETGFGIISSSISVSYPGWVSGVKRIPGTVDLSDYSENETAWKMKPMTAIEAETAGSVAKYGYAVIVTHPQEFLDGEVLDEANVQACRTLFADLKVKYAFITFKELGKKDMFAPVPPEKNR